MASPAALRHDVAIVGAGPVGLALLAALRRFGVDAVALERRSTATAHPQAHFLNTRSMECLQAHAPALAATMRRVAPPEHEWQRFSWSTQLQGGRSLAMAKVMDVGGHVARVSPAAPLHLAQHRLESLLRQALVEAGDEERLVLGQDVVGAELRPGGVTLRVQDVGAGAATREVTARYVVGCDGARGMMREAMGVLPEEASRADYATLLSVHFTSLELGATLQNPAPGESLPSMLYFTYNPGGVAVLVAHDLSRGDFVCQLPSLGLGTDAELVKAAVQAMIGGAPTDLKIHAVQPWAMRTRIASSYRAEAGFLAGDAAHTFPPAGGFGLNTGLQDAHNLAWKLAAALRQEAAGNSGAPTQRLLDSYDTERRPVAQEAARLSEANYQRTVDCARSLGLDLRMAEATERAASCFLPESLRNAALRAAVKVGLFPTHALGQPGNPYGELCIKSLRSKVDGGRSLPLIFPRYELGTQYYAGALETPPEVTDLVVVPEENALVPVADADGEARTEGGEGDDGVEGGLPRWGTGDMAFVPRLAVGLRLPHVALLLRRDYWLWEGPPSGALSTVDLGAQVHHLFAVGGQAEIGAAPWAVLLSAREAANSVRLVMRTLDPEVLNLAHVDVEPARGGDGTVEVPAHLVEVATGSDVTARACVSGAWRAGMLCEDVEGTLGQLWENAEANVALVRPDGVVCWLGTAPGGDGLDALGSAFESDLRRALGTTGVLVFDEPEAVDPATKEAPTTEDAV